MAHSLRSNLQLFLDRLTRRSVLTDAEQQAVLNLPGHVEQVRTHCDFVQPGRRVDHACLVVAGIVGRFEDDREGRRQITALHIPGDMCDLHSVVLPLPTYALQALSVATILRVPHASIKAAAGRYPTLAEAFWRDCMADASIMSEWIVNIGRRDARARLAHLICEMATRLGVVDANEFGFDLALTQEQLAQATSLTPVHVNRTLKGLQAEGVVQWHHRALRVLDWKVLVDVAEFDTAYLHLHAEPQQRLSLVQA